MKHPALARVFAVVLVIMGAIMLAVGISGFGKAEDERDERDGYSDKLDSKLAAFDLLHEQLDGGESYDEAAEELEQQQEQHDSDASQHRTDLATYSATRGGYKMGADQLWEAKTQLEEAKAQMAQMETAKAAMAAAAAECTEAAGSCTDAASGLDGLTNELASISANSDLTDEAKQAAYMAALYKNMDALTAASSAVSAGMTAYENAVAALPDEAKSALPDMSGSSVSVPSIDASTLMYMTPEQLAALMSGLSQLPNGLNQLAAGLTQMAAGLTSAQDAIDTAASQALSQMSSSGVSIPEGLSASEIIAYLEQQVADGEAQIQGNLELIWYELGELDKDKAELEEEKTALDAEASELDAMQAAADALKELENEYKTTKATLTNVDEIGARVDGGESIHDAATAYIAEYRAQTEDNYRVRLIIAALTVAAAATAFAALPAAFEKTKKRFWLAAPAIACLICSVATEALSVAFGFDQHYAAIITAIFALVYLLAALPREKTIAG